MKTAARRFGDLGGGSRPHLVRRAQAAWVIYLAWLRAGLCYQNGQADFPRWLSRESGASRDVCRRSIIHGRRLVMGDSVRWTQRTHLENQREAQKEAWKLALAELNEGQE